MIRKNIKDVQFEECELFNKVVFFTNDRIDRRGLPDNVYVYELRHESGDVSVPIEIADDVTVDFYGSILTNEQFPIDLNENYVDIISEYDLDPRDYPDESKVSYDDPQIQGYCDCPSVNIWHKDDIPVSRIHPKNESSIRKPITLFISQPFTGYDDNEIRKQRKLLHELYAIYVGRPITDILLIDQLDVEDEYDKEENFDNANDRSFYQLCRSIGMMKRADVVLFYGEWTKSKGAMIEYDICRRYKKNSVGNKELIEFCKNNPEYDDDYFMPLWKKQFFDMHDIADVNIFKDPKCGFKATAELNCNGYTASGDTPNDAYLNLYDMLEEIIHAKMVNQIDSLGKAKAVQIVVCNDAETITDSDINKIIRDDKPGDAT